MAEKEKTTAVPGEEEASADAEMNKQEIPETDAEKTVKSEENISEEAEQNAPEKENA